MRLTILIIISTISTNNSHTGLRTSRMNPVSTDLSVLAGVGAVVRLVEYRTRNREVAGSTHTRTTASNLEQVANLLCAQANSASYPQQDRK